MNSRTRINLLLRCSVFVMMAAVCQPSFSQLYQYKFEFGGFGHAPGQLFGPTFVTAGNDGNFYVSDTGNHRIQVFDNSGNFLFGFGSNGSANGQFKSPNGIAVMDDGTIVVVDRGNDRIQLFDQQGNFLHVFGGSGGGPSQFGAPVDVDKNALGQLVIGDQANHRVQIIETSGQFVSQFGQQGTGNGQFQFTHGVSIQANGNMTVTDYYNHRVQVFDSNADFLMTFGTMGTGNGKLMYPIDNVVDAFGNFIVGDRDNARLSIFDSKGRFLETLQDLGAGSAPLASPHCVAIDSDGNLLVADAGRNRIVVLEPVQRCENLVANAMPINYSCDGGVEIFRVDSNNNWNLIQSIPGTSLNDPASVIFAPDEELFVANRHCNMQLPSTISRFVYDPSSDAFVSNGTISGNSLESVHDLAFSPWGELFATNWTNGTISRFTFQNGVAIANGTINVPQPSSPHNLGLTFSPDGELYSTTYTELHRFTFDSNYDVTNHEMFDLPGILHFPGFDPVFGDLFIARNNSPGGEGSVLRYEIDPGNNLVFKESIRLGVEDAVSIGIAFDCNNNLIVGAQSIPGNQPGIYQYRVYEDCVTQLRRVDTAAGGGVAATSPGCFAFDLIDGVVVSGSLDDLAISDNNDFVIRRSPTSIDSRIEFEQTVASPSPDPSLIRIQYEGSVFARPAIVQRISLFDFQAGAWVTVDERFASRFGDRQFTVEYSLMTERFVSSLGCVRARVEFEGPLNRTQITAHNDLLNISFE
ncbi:MAG: NHL repeat-containing protein [Planctomycetota bacterium]